MKKIIAAALSVLVGAFGYTIVDSTIENRVSRLESEVYELREEISNQHSENISEELTDKDDVYIGKQFKDSGSRSKFLIRIHDDGLVKYISPQNYVPRNDIVHAAAIDSTTICLDDPRLTTSKEETTIVLEYPQETTKADSDYSENSSESDINTTVPDLYDPRETTNQHVTGWYEEKTTYYSSSTPGDYFVYLNNVSAVVTDVNIENSLYYDKDYSSATKPLCLDFTFTITYQGRTDPALAGEKINFDTQLFDGYIPSSHYGRTNINGNTINADGSFSYTETYKIYRSDFYTDFMPFVNFNYSVQSVELYK